MKDYKVDKESFPNPFGRKCTKSYPRYLWEKYLLMEVLLCCWGTQCSRMVGRALKEVPDELSIPCHRVVNSTGRLVPGWWNKTTLAGRRSFFQS